MMNGKYFTLKEFPEVGRLVLVKPHTGGGYYGLRYLAENKILVYSEYHESELEPWVEPTQLSNTIEITDTNPQ